MSTHKPTYRTHRNYKNNNPNDRRQPSLHQNNINYQQSQQHYHSNNNNNINHGNGNNENENRPYSYIINQHPVISSPHQSQSPISPQSQSNSPQSIPSNINQQNCNNHIHSNVNNNNNQYNSQRKNRNYNNNNHGNNNNYHHRNRHGYNGQNNHNHHHHHNNHHHNNHHNQYRNNNNNNYRNNNNNNNNNNNQNNQYLSQYQNYNQHHNPRPSSNPPISSDILICIDNVGPELIQYLPASTAYYLIEVIEPYLTNQNNSKNNGVPTRRKSELLSKWHNSYASWKRMNEYLEVNDLMERLSHFNNVNTMNDELNSNLCIWDITIKKTEIEQLFGSKRNLMIRAILSYIIMESFLMNKHNVWFPPKPTKLLNNQYILIKKQLNLRDIHKFLLSKLQKIDDIKKFYNINPNLMKEKIMNSSIVNDTNSNNDDGDDNNDNNDNHNNKDKLYRNDNEYLLKLLNEFKSRFERDNFGGDTLLYCQSWECDKFENILSIGSKKYPMDKNKKRPKKSHIYELGYRSRLDKPIFGFYIGKHRGYNPRTKGIELKFNPLKTYSYFYDLKLLFLPEFIEDCVTRYFSFDVKWESDYTRGEQFKYYNLICANINTVKSINDIYQTFKFVVWKGQYFDADDNLLGQY